MDTAALDLAGPFRARVGDTWHDFGRAPHWCRELPYERIPAHASIVEAAAILGFLDWEPGDQLCGTDGWSHWALYDQRADGTADDHPRTTMPPYAVRGIADLIAAATSEYDQRVQLVLFTVGNGVAGTWLHYPAFTVCAWPETRG